MPNFAVPFHLDQPLADFDPPVAIDRSFAPELSEGTPWERMAALYEEVAVAVAAETSTLVVSGDCTTSLASVAGRQRRGDDLGIVWFDAHGDFNTEDSSESGYLAGMTLAKICGRGELDGLAGLGLTAIDPGRVLLVGARDIDGPERELLEAAGVRLASVAELRLEDLPAGPLYVHLDCDVVDPTDMPGLIFPTPDGPSIDTMAAALRTVATSRRVGAVGMALTLDGPIDPVAAGSVGAMLDALRSPDRAGPQSSPR
jgi:arginase